MTTYAIGDIQGCLEPFKKLLETIRFDNAHDTLWLTGDLVNRGPHSLEVLRFIKSLGEKHVVVLGNHDFHLLAVAQGLRQEKKSDTLNAILSASDCKDLIEWLRFRPLCHYDESLNYAISHAGLAPMWNVKKALLLAKEVEEALRGRQAKNFLKQLFANEPICWRDDLAGIERLRCIVNYFTRMRFCTADGCLDFEYKGSPAAKPPDLISWFEMPDRANADTNIIFGHWAALEGKANVPNVYPLDTGCVWGGCLTAMALESEEQFRVVCKEK